MIARNMPQLFAFSLICVAPAVAHADTPELFTSGHGDIAVEYDEAADELEVHWHFEGAMVGGKMIGEEHDHEGGDDHNHEEGDEHGHEEGAERHIEDVIFATGQTFVRPGGAGFELLGVDVGQPVFYLPQSREEAEQLQVPFLGWAFEAPEGVFKDNAVELTLVSVNSPQPGNSSFSLWTRSGLTPDFAMSSADGISSQDSVTFNHEHFSMGLGLADQARDLSLEFEARAEKLNGQVLTKRFTVAAKTCEGACRVQAAPAPAIGALGPLGLLLGLGGLFRATRRQRA